MNHLLRTCKCHWSGGEYHHWSSLLLRKPFSPPGTTPKFAPDAPVSGGHMRLELHLDFAAERVWGTTTHQCLVNAAEVGRVGFNAIALEIGRVRVDGKPARFENTGQLLEVTLPRKYKRGARFAVEIRHSVTRPAAGIYFTTPDEAYPERFHTAWL